MDDLTKQLESGDDLDRAGVAAAARALLDDSVPVPARAAFLSALALKGETPDEIAWFVEEFLGHAVDPGLDPATLDRPLLDVCGTGGDKLDLFNVSTTAMFIVAAGGVGVVKHGNRKITSKSGGADVLEALGVPIDLPPEQFAECVRRHGIGFMLAPQYHPAFKAVAPVRQELAARGQRTIFNMIGPLLNPVQPPFQLLGAFSPDLPPVYAQILNRLGRQRAWSVCGDAGDGRWMDEISTLGRTIVAQSGSGGGSGSVATDQDIDPAALGFAPPVLDDLRGGDAAENATLLERILSGDERGPKRDLAVLNAAAGLTVAGAAPNLTDAVATANHLVDSGAATAKLQAMRG